MLQNSIGLFNKIVKKKTSISLHELQEFIRRDLEDLLNTMQGRDDLPSYYPELCSSLATYGLSGFNSANLESHSERHRLLRSIKRVIETFEPRLQNVVIEDLGMMSTFVLHFGIKARISVENESLSVEYGTTIQKYGSAKVDS